MQKNNNGDTPLLCYLYYNCSNINKTYLKYLIEKGANLNDINKQGNTPLLCLCPKNTNTIYSIGKDSVKYLN